MIQRRLGGALARLLVLATFLAAGPGSVYGSHGCAHHGGPTAPVPEASAADPGAPHHGPAAATPAHGDHVGSHAHGAPVSSDPAAHGATGSDPASGTASPSSSHHGDDEGPCTCVGDCHAGAATPVATAAAPQIHAEAVLRVLHPAAADPDLRVHPDLYELPRANAPPLQA